MLWSGPKTTPEIAVNHFGIDEAYSIDKLQQVMKNLNVPAKNSFVETDENSFCTEDVLDTLGFVKDRIAGNADVLLQWMRVVKDSNEIECMKRISESASSAFQSIIGHRWTGKYEYELAAKFQFECTRRGAEMLAYTPVVASGENALILHYIQNRKLMKEGEVVLVDAGAYHNCYNTDVSRTFPVSGRFTDEQKELYQAVLRVQKMVIEVCLLQSN